MNTLSYIPLLTEKISNCYDTNYNQSLDSQLTFDIQNPCGCTYADGAPVNVTKFNYSYSLLGIPRPIPFFLNGKPYTLNFYKGPIGVCLRQVIPTALLNEIETALASAQDTLTSAQAILADPAGKEDEVYALARLSATSDTQAAAALRDLINFNYPVSSSNLYSGILSDIANALTSQAAAQSAIADIVGTTNPVNLNAYQLDIDNAATSIISGAEAILASNTDPTGEAAILANAAISYANYALQQSSQLTSTSSIDDLLEPLFSISRGIKTLINSLALVSESFNNPTFILDLERLEILDSAISYSLEGINAANDIAESTDPTEYITTAAQFFASNAQLLLIALAFDDIFVDVSYYDYFAKTMISVPCCNNEASTNVQFLANINRIDICNLNIQVCGTIGCIPFTATSTLANTQSLAQLGFNPFNISTLVEVPCNTKFNIIQKITPQISINNVVPITAYDSTANSFTANVFSTLCLNSNIFITTQEPVPATVYSTPIVCQPAIPESCPCEDDIF